MVLLIAVKLHKYPEHSGPASPDSCSSASDCGQDPAQLFGNYFIIHQSSCHEIKARSLQAFYFSSTDGGQSSFSILRLQKYLSWTCLRRRGFYSVLLRHHAHGGAAGGLWFSDFTLRSSDTT